MKVVGARRHHETGGRVARVVAVIVMFFALHVPMSRAAGEPGPQGMGVTHSPASADSVDSSAPRGINPPVSAIGELIYRRGILASGKPLEGRRDDGMHTSGASAACVNCHQRSGLGAKEGLSYIPPITGRYLFHAPVKGGDGDVMPFVEGMRPDREAYTEKTLAKAIREGIGANGKPLTYLMPRYALSDADMAALIKYLKGLDKRTVPGVTDSELHFATIVTPDADPVARQGMLDVMQHYFEDRNSTQRFRAPRLQSNRGMVTMFHAVRRWELHVWDLTGSPDSWEAQLRQHFSREPVFAVVSGLAGKSWTPVHDFCEHEGVPCLFPNVEVPVGDSRDFYSLYFSKGVLLEADLIAYRLRDIESGKQIKVVDQIYREGDNGEAGAGELADMLRGAGVTVRSHQIPAQAPGTRVAEDVRRVLGSDAIVLWLRPADIRSLTDVTISTGPRNVFMSAVLGGLEGAPVPASWRERTMLAYPFDLPERRVMRVDYPLGWFRIRGIPVVAQQLQADTYIACGLLSETLSHMVDTFVPEYLVERLQDTVEHRVVTGYYPQLRLATGQRFASKGGYLVHFADPTGMKLAADSGWITP